MKITHSKTSLHHAIFPGTGMCVLVICDEYKPLCLREQQAYIPQHLDTSLTESGRLLWCVGCHGCCRHVQESGRWAKNTFRWQYWVKRRERYNGRIWEDCVCRMHNKWLLEIVWAFRAWSQVVRIVKCPGILPWIFLSLSFTLSWKWDALCP